MNAAEWISAALGGARREGRGWRCRCPFHGGHRRVVGDGREGRLLVKCRGGGRSVREIVAELSRQGLVGDERPGDNAGHMVDDRGNERHDGARLVEIGRIRSTQLHRNQIRCGQSRSSRVPIVTRAVEARSVVVATVVAGSAGAVNQWPLDDVISPIGGEPVYDREESRSCTDHETSAGGTPRLRR